MLSKVSDYDLMPWLLEFDFNVDACGDIKLAQRLAERIVALAGKIARSRDFKCIADGRVRNCDWSDHD